MKEKLSPQAIFHAALDISDESERASYLKQTCQDDAALREEVDSLLAALAAAGSFLQPLIDPGSDELGEKEGDCIGRYKLLEQIGEGGFGSVWMAEQQEPMRRKVALKIIKLGMDTREVLGRFESERQALALMDHPNIAKVFDGGATETGRPFFVMELVRGVAITEYCDANKLTPSERIDLFRKVCLAVQHAHQKGIIHRDLKPSNILVTVQDDQAVPKIIDFGVAKALQSRLTERTLFTRFSQWVGTPAYMSPEQAGLGSLDVDTRSDVYSLGTILYELLIGRTPFDSQKLREKGYDAVIQTIREEDVPKPSTTLSSLSKEDLIAVADHRSESPGKLDHDIKGELDWILLKALERNRTRRYDTASALAKDLELYFDGLPVSAVPPSFIYQAGKFVRKYRRPVAVAATIVSLIVIGGIASTVLAIRANRAEKEARFAENEAARQRYNANMLLAGTEWENHEPIRVREILASLVPSEGESDFRGWEWYYLQALMHQEIHILRAGDSPVRTLAWSPDSSRVALAGDDGVIQVWNAAKGRRELQVQTFSADLPAEQRGISALAWHPDGQRIATGSKRGTITAWDSNSGDKVFQMNADVGEITALAITATGDQLVSGSVDGRVHIWNMETGKTVHQLKHHKSKAVSVLLTANDENLIAVYESGWVAAWRMRDGDEVYVVHLTGGNVREGAYSVTTDRLFLCGGGSKIIVANASTGERLSDHWNNPEWTVSAISVSPDGKHLCTGGRKGEVVVWDSDVMGVKTMYPGRSMHLTSLAHSPDGRWLASASVEGTVSLWNAHRLGGASVEISGINWAGTTRWSPNDDRLVIDEMKPYAKVINGSNGALIQRLGPHKGRTMNAAWSHDGTRVATAGYYEPIRVWDADTGDLLKSLEGKFGNSFEVVWSPTEEKLAGLYAKASKPPVANDSQWQLCIWNTDTGELIHGIDGDFQGMRRMAWSSRDLIAVPANQSSQVDVYDANSGEKKNTLSVGENEGWAVRSVDWSPDGRFLAAGGGGGMIYMWDITTGEMLYEMQGHTDRVFDVAWSPDGTRLATASWDSVVKIWNAETGELVFIIYNQYRGSSGNHSLWTLDWNRDGTKLATGSMDFTTRIYDASKGYKLSGDTRENKQPEKKD